MADQSAAAGGGGGVQGAEPRYPVRSTRGVPPLEKNGYIAQVEQKKKEKDAWLNSLKKRATFMAASTGQMPSSNPPSGQGGGYRRYRKGRKSRKHRKSHTSGKSRRRV